VPLLIDLYEPSGGPHGPRPVVIVIHGGGFTSQSRLDPGIVRIPGGIHGFTGSQFLTAEVAPGETPYARLLAFAESTLGLT
jgi:hypothetical protein